MAAEHGYTALSRARGETHLWVNTSRTVDGRCVQPGQPAYETPVEALVRQLTRSVIQPPALAAGVALANATDQQLHRMLDDLETVIRSGPLGESFDPGDPPGIHDAIEDARAVAQRLGTSGTRTHVEHLERERQELLDQIEKRGEWVEDHAELLHTYTSIKDELAARTTALAVSYQLNPPDDVLEAPGARPAKTIDAKRWDAAVIHHAAARIRLGPDTDLNDPAVLEASSWRDAINAYQAQPDLERTPVLSLAG